jgi:hypothetical protein
MSHSRNIIARFESFDGEYNVDLYCRVTYRKGSHICDGIGSAYLGMLSDKFNALENSEVKFFYNAGFVAESISPDGTHVIAKCSNTLSMYHHYDFS